MSIITLDEYKTYKGITSSEEDVYLTSTISAVNSAIENYIGYPIEAKDHVDEIYDGPGSNSLRLAQYPILSITSVQCYDETLEEVSFDDRNNGKSGYWIKDAKEGILWNNDVWPRGRGVIKITYRAGYDPVPEDLKQAAFEIVDYYRNIKGKAGILSESLGSYGYSLDNRLDPRLKEWAIPNFAIIILGKYVEQLPVGGY